LSGCANLIYAGVEGTGDEKKRKFNSFSVFQPYLLKQQGVSIWHSEHTE
jgi:hypothetical protein